MRRDGPWLATWAASPQRADPDDPPLQIAGQTLRQTLHVSLGGPRVRVRLSNRYGTAALVIGAAHVALGASGSSIQPGTDRALSFGGSPGVTIPAGAHVVSDPVSLTVPARADLAVSLYLPGAVSATTEHAVARATSYVSTAGDYTAAGALAEVAATTRSWHFVSGVEVESSPRARSIVAFGGSITDGVGSTHDANHRLPDLLARRLVAAGTAPRAVVNAGIAGNRLLSDLVGDNGLARFDRDVLAQAGTRYVIVLIGTNDVGVVTGAPDATADQIIVGHRQLIARAHALGIKALGATLTPFEGATIVPGFYTAAGDAKRDAVNRWIRTSSEYDAVIDFDRVLRDPGHPARLRTGFDSGDHLHPNDAGYQAMADAIDLSLFDEP
jgi:lysophospholipase L1-like esterase